MCDWFMQLNMSYSLWETPKYFGFHVFLLQVNIVVLHFKISAWIEITAMLNQKSVFQNVKKITKKCLKTWKFCYFWTVFWPYIALFKYFAKLCLIISDSRWFLKHLYNLYVIVKVNAQIGKRFLLKNLNEYFLLPKATLKQHNLGKLWIYLKKVF